MRTKKRTTPPSSQLIHIELTPGKTPDDEYVLRLATHGKNPVHLFRAKKQLLTSVFSDIQARVRIMDPVLSEAARTGSSDLGPFPLLPLDSASLVALYIAILAERDLVAHGQIIWP